VNPAQSALFTQEFPAKSSDCYYPPSYHLIYLNFYFGFSFQCFMFFERRCCPREKKIKCINSMLSVYVHSYTHVLILECGISTGGA
jgi:hypothetical protein